MAHGLQRVRGMRHGKTAAVLVLSVLACALAAPLAQAAEAPSANEYVGLELAPGWLNVAPSALGREVGNEGNSSYPRYFFHRYSTGIAGTLRVMRMAWGRWYWTPLQFGAGVETKSAFLGHISTEVGLRQSLGEDRFIEIGTAVGGGWVWVLYDTWCDGHCYEGGMPFVASPVVRLGLAGRRASAALFARALLPLGHLAGDAWGMAFLFGLDVGFGRR
jgi:hypothetical protein